VHVDLTVFIWSIVDHTAWWHGSFLSGALLIMQRGGMVQASGIEKLHFSKYYRIN
jgi:hypothetical protein